MHHRASSSSSSSLLLLVLPLALPLVLSMMVQSSSAQLPLRIDVTWFERHDEWKRLIDANYGDAKNGDDATANDAAAAAADEGESDRHTQQLMRELSSACKTSTACIKKSPFDKITCIRKCVSNNCYASVYGREPLEPGEIDVNYSKYKRCFHTLYRNKYRSHLKQQH